MFQTPPTPLLGPEKLCIGEKIVSLRQYIKKFGAIYRGAPFPYRNSSGYMCPGPLDPASSANYPYGLNSIKIDPAYFGVKTLSLPDEQTAIMPTATNLATGQATTTATFPVGLRLETNSPLNYISYLYRFWRGSKRYKVFYPATGKVNTTGGFLGATSSLSMLQVANERVSTPVVVKRRTAIITNGDILPVSLESHRTLTTSPMLEHTVFPDLSGCVEFEVPYYSPYPISLIAEGTVADTDGPLISRSIVDVTSGFSPESLDVPVYTVASGSSPSAKYCMRTSLGEVRVFAAAGDDFSFGYLVGAPKIVRRLA
jgi:hypothetical protein